MEHDLINKIKGLKEIRPDSAWKESNRAFLMSVAGEMDAKQKANLGLIGRIRQIGQISQIRPGFAAALVVIFTIVGCAYAINISKKSLPGDMLWNVKISLEKAQTTFSSGEERVKLETKFAEKRLKEMEEISKNGDGEPIKTQKMAQAIENLKGHIDEAKKEIRELENRGRKSANQGSLTEVGTPAPSGVGAPETYAAINKVEEESEAWEQELREKIKEKIEILRLAQNDNLEAEIEEAEELLEEGRLVEALEKVLEAERMRK